MKSSRVVRFFLALVTGALLAACGQSANAILPQRSAAIALVANAATQQLLYVSEPQTNGVNVYSYPYLTFLGTITGLATPGGLCVDTAGDVFVTEQHGQAVRKYLHGSITAKATFKDPGYTPVSCAFDAATGNLAVGNSRPILGSGSGNVTIYSVATGRLLAQYTGSNLYVVDFCGYDGSGNLFVDGLTQGGTFVMSELPKGAKSFVSISLNQTIYFPGGVQWDGKYLAVGDLGVPAIYRFSLSGQKGTKLGTVPLTGGSEIVQFWIQGPKVVGPDAQSGAIGLWKYPSGGKAVKLLKGLNAPFGATISSAGT
jgi:hypothetical protein